MYENQLNQSVQEFAYRLQSQGLDLDTYLKYSNTNIDEFKKGAIVFDVCGVKKSVTDAVEQPLLEKGEWYLIGGHGAPIKWDVE